MNPYNWQSHTPQVQVPQADVDRLVQVLTHNGSAVVMGGRGMGKSVFLGQLKAQLERQPGTRVLLLDTPPAALTVEACLGFLAIELGVTPNPYSSRRFFDEYFARADAPERLVLLFDEFDRYAEKGEPSAQPPGRGFFNDLEAARRALPRLGLLAVGSVGVFVFRDVLGSSFLSRATHLRLRPLNRAAAMTLAEPFAEHGTPLPEDTLDAILLASGGIPALLTFGLQELWSLGREATPHDVTVAYKTFEEEHDEYLHDLLGAISNPRLSDAPLRVWERLGEGSGRVAREQLEAALGEPSGVLTLKLSDALRLLEAVGIVRLESSAVHDNPVVARPIPSLLNLSRGSAECSPIQARFRCNSSTVDDLDVRVDHFLMRLPRRSKAS